MAQITGNQFLCQLLEISRIHTHQVQHMAWLHKRRIQQSIKQHREILSALGQKDQERYEEAVERHMESGKRDFQRLFSVQCGWDLRFAGISSNGFERTSGPRQGKGVEKKTGLFPNSVAR
jgi:hypothetical protein